MHRSGTSLLTSLLGKLGLFTGFSRGHAEAWFFQRLNRSIEKVGNCGWDTIESLNHLASVPRVRDQLLVWLEKEIRSPKAALYFGWPRLLRQRSITRFPHPWGWKDPRNTFTYDLWRDLFPQAKVVHIHRNGVDVAASLLNRQKVLKARPESEYFSVRCGTLDGAFSVWRCYVKKAFAVSPPGGPDFVLHISFEEFLERPGIVLEDLAHFCDLHPTHSQIKNAIEQIDRKRAYAFPARPELVELYQAVRHDPWMQKLGYADILKAA